MPEINPETGKERPAYPENAGKPKHLRKNKVTPPMKKAILELIDLSNLAPLARGQMKDVAIRCGVKASSLKTNWHRYKSGQIDLEAEELPCVRLYDMQKSIVKRNQVLCEMEEYLTDEMAIAMAKVRNAAAKGRRDAFQKLLSPIVVQASKVANLRIANEKAFETMVMSLDRQKRMGAEKLEKIAKGEAVTTPAGTIEKGDLLRSMKDLLQAEDAVVVESVIVE